MGTSENSDRSKRIGSLKRHSHKLELSLSWFGSQTEQSLVRKFDNLGLKSNKNETTIDEKNESGGVDDSRFHPLRPYAEDCSFFLRTGKCKFGLNCRFNHPVTRIKSVVREIDTESCSEGFPQNSNQIACKYHLTAGGCKYGDSCKFNHSKTKSEIAPPELNFLGLPIRLGEKECPFYMRNGTCGYGDCCRFHHPEPGTVGGSDTYSSTPNGESVGYFCDTSGIIDGESLPLHLSGGSSARVSWNSPLKTNKSASYLDNHSSYISATSLDEGLHQTPEWSWYEPPNYSQERKPHSVPAADVKMDEADLSKQVEELPEHPGQPICEHFMKTGDCKVKSACRYHHPKSFSLEKEVCVLNDKGLPLRPGKKICWHYENLGLCKNGRACAFDHPVNQDSSVAFDHPVNQDSSVAPDVSTSESPGSGGNGWSSWID